jgi:hypothetical protein
MFVFVLCVVCPMSLDCPLLIVPSVFYNVYLLPTVCLVSCVSNVANVSGLSLQFSLMFISYLRLSGVPSVASVSELSILPFSLTYD